MMKIGTTFFLTMIAFASVQSQGTIRNGYWKAQLLRNDGQHIVFNFEVKQVKQQTEIYLVNGIERMKVKRPRFMKDSVVIDMPVFESQFRAKLTRGNQMTGTWTKAGSKGPIQMPFTAQAPSRNRFSTAKAASAQITGRWAIDFINENGKKNPAIGEFQQKGNALTGTILTPTGDYRYLEGVVSGDTLKLSTFDGSHAFFFTARIQNDQQLTQGKFYSGPTSIQQWTAQKNPSVTLPESAAMYLREGEDRLNFRFRDLNGQWVSINDARFQNKVVLVQIMGSWCPNCMDETAFLSEYYKKNKQRGVEVVALAYEYSTDFNEAKISVQKFKDRFQVQYPLLITGVTVSDTLRTEKTLPQLTPIRSFPSTIFIDKKGRVAKLHAGFAGPGTGEHYLALKKEFEEIIDGLLKEK